MKFLRWLLPASGFKRWFGLFAVGIVVAATGLAALMDCKQISALQSFMARWFGPIKPLSALHTGCLWVVAGFFLTTVAANGVIKAVYQMAVPKSTESLGNVLLSRRHLERGPKIVVVGGGTGLSSLLRGLKQYTDNITALVTVSDDGGSSGRLRNDLGMMPPGDIRNCLVALAEAEPLMQTLFQHRFKEGGALSGHNFGNLFIAALTEVTGDFEQAIRQSSKVLAVRGRVLPSSADNVVLCAELEDGSHIKGETEITRAPSRIKRVYLEPANARAMPDALSAIEEADAVIIGPGSLYTSIISSLAVEGISEAISDSGALKVYVCNIMTQPNETAGYTANDHVRAIVEHAGRKSLDVVLLNDAQISPGCENKYREQGSELIKADTQALERDGFTVVTAGLVGLDTIARHEPQTLARVLMKILLQHRGGAIRNRLLGAYLDPQRTKG